MKKISDRLDELRKPGESKKDFARRIGISPVQLSRYYAGVAPGRKVLTRIARHTGASLDWLMQGRSRESEPAGAVRLGAKTGRSLNDRDMLDLAGTYIDEISCINREQKEIMKEIISLCTSRPEHLAKLKAYLNFLKYENGQNKSRK